MVPILNDSDLNSRGEFLFLIELFLQRVCKDVQIESHKSIIKQARVQHLYGRFLGTLHNEADEVSLPSFICSVFNLLRCVQLL